MSVIFETKFELGSYLERFSGAAMVNTNGEIKRSEKGYAWRGNGSNTRIAMPSAITLSRDNASIELWFKGYDTTGVASRFFLARNQAGYIYLGQIAGFLRLESNTNGDFWLLAAGGTISGTKWNHLLVIADAGTVNTYLNNELFDTTTPSDDVTFTTIGANEADANNYLGDIAKVKFSDNAISADERARAFDEFLNAKSPAIEKYPKYNPHTKPTDGSQEAEKGCIAWWNMIPNNTVLVDISGNGNNGTIPSAGPSNHLDGLVFRANSYITVAGFAAQIDIDDEITFALRVKPRSTAVDQTILNTGDAGGDRIAIGVDDASNNFVAIYYDGASHGRAGAAKIDEWSNLVYVINAKAHVLYINGEVAGSNNTISLSAGNDLIIGARSVAFTQKFDGEIEDLRIYTVAKDAQFARDYHNYYANRVVLIDHFRDAAVGQSKAREWKFGTGTYVINELDAQDAVLKDLDIGVKYLECSVAGTIAIPSKQAYGEWEFYVYKGADDNVPYVGFINTNPNASATSSLYSVSLNAAERILLKKENTNLLFSAVSYVANSTWYCIKLTRTLDGEFYTYIKGGAFGSEYVLVSVTGGSGTNPVTDNTYTTSEYFILDFDAGDRIALLNIQQGVEQ